MRSDAVANRRRLLAVAETYFGERGIDASLHELVARAGVGIGTLYRHFPTHADLIRALHDRLVERIDLAAEEAERGATGWDAVVAFIDGALAVLLELPASAAILERASRLDAGRTLVPSAALERVVERARAEGSLRPDVAAPDILLLPFLLAGVTRLPEADRGPALARQRAIAIDGLRAPK